MAKDVEAGSAGALPARTVGTAGARTAPRPQPIGDDDARRINLVTLSALALVIGIVTGLGAVVFRDLIGLVHNLFFLGKLAIPYDASTFTPESPWGPLVILVPVIGGLGVTFLVANFAPEAKGHGVPEVMDAIYYQGGIIRPVVAVVKSLASALAIGSGAAVGREGPIIQIGSALGSTFGQVIRMAASQRITLVAAGAGAGIAATFNTPIGGVLFATELMMPEISVNTFLPVAIATGTATYLGRLFFGVQPAFLIPTSLASLSNSPTTAITLVLYAVLGAITGVAAALMIRGLHWAEDAFDKIPGRYGRHALGMLLVGILIYVLHVTAGHYYVEGVGYSTIQATLLGQMSTAPLFLLLLFACKLIATSLSLGSGSSGGVFSPSLYMGSMVGAAFASLITAVFPGAPVSLPAFAMVGMGAMVGGGTGAAMTSVTMIFEMTRDYEIVLPMILAVALSLFVRRLLSRENIYTLKLFRRGHPIPKAMHANMFLVRSAAEVMERDVLVLDGDTSFDSFLQMPQSAGGLRHVIVTRGNRIRGAIRINTDLRRAIGKTNSDVTLGEIAPRNFTIVRENDAAFDVIARIWRKRAAMAIVIAQDGLPRADRVMGVITKEHVADSVASSVRFYPR